MKLDSRFYDDIPPRTRMPQATQLPRLIPVNRIPVNRIPVNRIIPVKSLRTESDRLSISNQS